MNIKGLKKELISLLEENVDKGSDHYIALLPSDKQTAIESVEVMQNAWSNGSNGGVKKHFYDEFNYPETFIKMGKACDAFVNGNSPEIDFRDLKNLSFVAKVKDETGHFRVASYINLQLDHVNRSAERGRLAAHKSFQGKGLPKELTKKIDSLNSQFIQYCSWADSNTMHPITQMFNKKFGFNAVGFSPLKYLIPNAKYFKTNGDDKYIYWDDRVSTILNSKMLPKHVSERDNNTYVVKEVLKLQEHALLKTGVDAKVNSEIEGDLPNEIMQKGGDFVDDDVCKWLKVKAGSLYDVESIINYAVETGKEFIEVDVPAEKGYTRLQKELIDNGFFANGYIPGFNYRNNGIRGDMVRFCYLPNKEQAREYCNMFKGRDENLEKILISDNFQVGNIVLENLENSLIMR